MAPELDLEPAIQALLDCRPLPFPSETPSNSFAVLCVIEAIARIHRTVLFGRDVPLDPPVCTNWGHLEVRGDVGRGASGTVYRAWDTRLAHEVALKLFAADGRPDHALQEGRLLARLHHPHIVRVLGADTHDGIAGLWMEFLEGDTLDEILARDGVFDANETLLVGLDLARALTAVHSAGLLHRDIKARNVLRERGGRLVLMDLGAGRAADTTPHERDEAGTPMYMAPEVLTCDPATVRSDIYSLGVLLYRLVTGTFPVMATDLSGLRAAHAAGERVPLDARRQDLAPEIVTTIECACHPDPDARYTSAPDFEAALIHALERVVAQRMWVASPSKRRLARWGKTLLIASTAIMVSIVTTLGAWNTTPGRAGRRALGLRVPPRSALYLTVNGGLAILRGGHLSLFPYNPATARVIAVSSDLGVRTMSGIPPWTMGGGFGLDGTPIAMPFTLNEGLCCWGDGTTDGQFNYAARMDSTLLEPIGSRPLAPAGLYKFGRDWSRPQLYFPLVPDGVYPGVAYSAKSNTFWLTRRLSSESTIEQWSRDGKYLSTLVTLPTAVLAGIAIDPKDHTLWVVRTAGVTRLENFDTSGRHLASVDLEWPYPFFEASGAEFEWIRPN